MEQWFRPMDLNLVVVTDTPELDAAVRDAYGRFGEGDKLAIPQLRFEFHDFGSGDGLNRAPERSCRFSSATAELQLGDDGVLSVDRNSGSARGRFSHRVIADRNSFRSHTLHFALSAALTSLGFLGIHASCIAIEGRSALLRGASGAGKTTLAYASALRGFQLVTGSTVWVAPDECAWWGIPWWIYLRPSAAALFPEICGAPSISAGCETKHEIDLPGGSTVACTRPGVVIWVKRNEGGDTALEPIESAEMLRWWPQGAAGNEADAEDYNARIRRLLQRPNYRLIAGNDIDHAVELIAAAARAGASC